MIERLCMLALARTLETLVLPRCFPECWPTFFLRNVDLISAQRQHLIVSSRVDVLFRNSKVGWYYIFVSIFNFVLWNQFVMAVFLCRPFQQQLSFPRFVALFLSCTARCACITHALVCRFPNVHIFAVTGDCYLWKLGVGIAPNQNRSCNAHGAASNLPTCCEYSFMCFCKIYFINDSDKKYCAVWTQFSFDTLRNANLSGMSGVHAIQPFCRMFAARFEKTSSFVISDESRLVKWKRPLKIMNEVSVIMTLFWKCNRCRQEKNKILMAMATQQAATYGLFLSPAKQNTASEGYKDKFETGKDLYSILLEPLSPILAHFQNIPSNLEKWKKRNVTLNASSSVVCAVRANVQNKTHQAWTLLTLLCFCRAFEVRWNASRHRCKWEVALQTTNSGNWTAPTAKKQKPFWGVSARVVGELEKCSCESRKFEIWRLACFCKQITKRATSGSLVAFRKLDQTFDPKILWQCGKGSV